MDAVGGDCVSGVLETCRRCVEISRQSSRDIDPCVAMISEALVDYASRGVLRRVVKGRGTVLAG